jgi:flagellar motor switch protein FliM
MSHDASLSIRQSTVNQRCLEIIKEIVNDGRLATVEFVVQILLQRHRVSDFSNLNVGDISDIPCLLLLLEIFRKVCGFFSYVYHTC